MLKEYNYIIMIAGEKLRMKILFDIYQKISYYNFFKVRFFKERKTNDLILKFI